MSPERFPRRSPRWALRLPRFLLTLYGLLGFAFLYLPIAVLIVFSFNSSAVITFPLQHFTLSWYRELREDFVLLGAVRNSIVVTAVTTVGATLVGTAAAFPLVRTGFRMKRMVNLFLLLPIVIPGILTGIALLILFVPVLNLTLSLNTVIAGQIVLAGPFVVLVVASRLYGFNQQLEAAAMDLGATPWRTFWHVTFPLILPGVLAGALITFTLTFDEFIVTFFTIGPDSTLPMYIWSLVKFGVTPKLNALASIIVVLTLGTLLTANSLLRRRAR